MSCEITQIANIAVCFSQLTSFHLFHYMYCVCIIACIEYISLDVYIHTAVNMCFSLMKIKDPNTTKAPLQRRLYFGHFCVNQCIGHVRIKICLVFLINGDPHLVIGDWRGQQNKRGYALLGIEGTYWHA